MSNGACHKHGGATVNGVASGTYKGKGYSKYLPERMQRDYADALADPERLSLTNEVALLRGQLSDVLQAMQAGDHISAAVHAAAGDIRKAYRDAQVAQRSGNAESFARAMAAWGAGLDDLSSSLQPAAAQESARQKSVQMTLAIERLTRSENQRVVELHGMVSLEQAMADRHALVNGILEALDTYVRDEGTRKAIRLRAASVFARLTGRRDVPALAAARDAEPVRDAEHSASDDR